jgi:hypothetical protein
MCGSNEEEKKVTSRPPCYFELQGNVVPIINDVIRHCMSIKVKDRILTQKRKSAITSLYYESPRL